MNPIYTQRMLRRYGLASDLLERFKEYFINYNLFTALNQSEREEFINMISTVLDIFEFADEATLLAEDETMNQDVARAVEMYNRLRRLQS